MPAPSSAWLRSLPAGPTNGSPSRSSRSPGCSPTRTIEAFDGPREKTTWVAGRHSSQPRQPGAAARRSSTVVAGGTHRPAPGAAPSSAGGSIPASVRDGPPGAAALCAVVRLVTVRVLAVPDDAEDRQAGAQGVVVGPALVT